MGTDEKRTKRRKTGGEESGKIIGAPDEIRVP